jgi:hypothetical protein
VNPSRTHTHTRFCASLITYLNSNCIHRVIVLPLLITILILFCDNPHLYQSQSSTLPQIDRLLTINDDYSQFPNRTILSQSTKKYQKTTSFLLCGICLKAVPTSIYLILPFLIKRVLPCEPHTHTHTDTHDLCILNNLPEAEPYLQL